MRRPAQPAPASKAHAHEIKSARATAFRELIEHAVGVGNALLSKQRVAVSAMTKAAGDGGPYAYCAGLERKRRFELPTPSLAIGARLCKLLPTLPLLFGRCKLLTIRGSRGDAIRWSGVADTGRASASQAEGRGFEPRLPLQPQHAMVEAALAGGLSRLLRS